MIAGVSERRGDGCRGPAQTRTAHHQSALVGDSLVYLAGAGLVGLGNLILLPLYTRCLSAAEFGVYALLDVTVLIAATIAQLGFGISYLKWYVDIEAPRRDTLLTSTAAVTFGAGLAAGGAVLTLARVSHWLPSAGGRVPLLLLAVIPIESLQAVLLADLRARRRSVAFCAAAAARLLVMVGAGVWFVQVQKQGIAGVFLGRAIGGAAGVGMLAWLTWPRTAPGFSSRMTRDMLRYGLPLVWSSLVPVGIDASGRYLLARYAGLEQVAIYMIALKISSAMQLVFLQPFGTAWSGVMFQIGRDRVAPTAITGMLGQAFLAAMTLAAGIAILSPVALPLFGNGLYRQAAAVIPWLLLPPAFRVLEYWSSFGLYMSHRTGAIAAVTSAGAAVNTGALILLLPGWGARGAAFAWILALVAMIAGYAWLSPHGDRLPPDRRTLAIGLLLWAAGATAAVRIPVGCSLRGVSWAALAVALVCGPPMAYGIRSLLRWRRTLR